MAAIARAHGLQFANTAHVALASCGDAVAHPVLFALDRLAELVLFDLFLFENLIAPGFEMAEAAGKPAGGAAIDPDRGVGDLFKKTTVVADDDKCAARLAQLVFQPFDGGQVEMVGRLVEQQDIGFRRHDAGKCCAARFAAGQPVRIFLAGQAQMFEQIGDAIGIVARTEARFGIGLHGRIAGEIGSLFEITDRCGWMTENFARLRLDHAGRDLHKCRFARAVAADEADAVARFHLQACAVQQRRAAEAQEDVVKLENGRCHEDRLCSGKIVGTGKDHRLAAL
ncbi:hypothetical protein D3C71_814040 [compost metagenome]